MVVLIDTGSCFAGEAHALFPSKRASPSWGFLSSISECRCNQAFFSFVWLLLLLLIVVQVLGAGLGVTRVSESDSCTMDDPPPTLPGLLSSPEAGEGALGGLAFVLPFL